MKASAVLNRVKEGFQPLPRIPPAHPGERGRDHQGCPQKPWLLWGGHAFSKRPKYVQADNVLSPRLGGVTRINCVKIPEARTHGAKKLVKVVPG